MQKVASVVRRTALFNVQASILNIDSILAAFVVMVFFVIGGNFTFDVWGYAGHRGSVFTQVKRVEYVASTE